MESYSKVFSDFRYPRNISHERAWPVSGDLFDFLFSIEFPKQFNNIGVNCGSSAPFALPSEPSDGVLSLKTGDLVLIQFQFQLKYNFRLKRERDFYFWENL